MALGPCRECGKEVSTEAQACPHCGAPVKIAAPKGLAVGCGALLIGAVVVAIIVGVNSEPSSSPAVMPPMSGSAHLQNKRYVIWKSQFAYDRGMRIMRATNEANDTIAALLMSSLVACLPSGGESVTIVATTAETREIIIESGMDKGCRGVVQASAVAP